MRLQYMFFDIEIVRQCLQQVNNLQSVAMKIKSIIIVKKLSFLQDEHSEKELHDEKILMKIHVTRHENDFSVRKILLKFSLKQFARILKNRKQKKIILLAIKNIRNEYYSNAMNLTNQVVFNKDLKSIDVLRADITMKEIFVNINLNSRVIKYKKTKSIKFSSVEVVEITKKFKKLTLIIKQ